MFQEYVDQLLFELKDASFFQLAPSSEDREAWANVPEAYRARLASEADALLQQPIPLLLASAYMHFRRSDDTSSYKENYLKRREMLAALVMGLTVQSNERAEERLADLIWAIAEETSWVLPENSPVTMGGNALPLPDLYEPLIDEAAANTALDLCVAAQIAGERLYALTPQLLERVSMELKRRIIDPFLTARDFDWMCGSKSRAVACLRGVMISFLSFETDNRRRWLCMRKAFYLFCRLIDQYPQDGSVPGGVSDWQNVVVPVMDCLTLIETATRGAINLYHETQMQLMCHYPVLCHIAEGWFVNPGAQSMRPVLSGAAMYRLGMSVRDGALCDLGAYLFRTQAEEPIEPLLLHRFRNALLRARLEGEEGKPPFRRQGYLNAQELMVARMNEDDEHGLALAIHGGNNGQIGGHCDVGDLLLFAHGQPVLVDAGFLIDSDMHTLPEIGAYNQVSGVMHRADDISCQLEEDFAMLSMNLSGAYPPEAHLTSWQRSVIFQRAEGTVQLMDIFDLSAFEQVHFHFLCACKPHLGERYAQIGPVRLRWEEGLHALVDELPPTREPWTSLWPNGLYRLTLSTDKPVDEGQFTFHFTALRTFG